MVFARKLLPRQWLFTKPRNGDTNFFVAGILQGDNTLAPYLFIIFLDYVLWIFEDLIKENGSSSKKTSSRRYPAENMTEADYADDQALVTNTQVQAEPILNSWEWTARGIGLYMNSNKTEYMTFKTKWAISILSGKLLKLVDQLQYLDSNISSTKSNFNV